MNSEKQASKQSKLGILNVPKHICTHIVGENHSQIHRLFVGVIVIVIGVGIANIHIGVIVVDMTAEGIGYVIHGIGSIPIVEGILRLKTEEHERQPINNKSAEYHGSE